MDRYMDIRDDDDDDDQRKLSKQLLAEIDERRTGRLQRGGWRAGRELGRTIRARSQAVVVIRAFLYIEPI